MFSSQSNLEILYQVLDEYTIQASESITVPPELENYQFSKRFEKHMQRLINRQKKSYYMLIDTVAKRVACYVVVVLTCLFVTVFSVKALREPFISFVVRTYEKFTSIFVDKDTVEPRAASTDFEIMLPTYIPEGYEMEEIVRDADVCMCLFVNDNGKEIFFTQHFNDSALTTIDTEKVIYEQIIINSVDGLFYTNKDISCIVFGNEKYSFNISGDLSKKELIKIAESIK